MLDGYDDVLAHRRACAAQMLDGLVAHGYEHQSATEGAAWQFVPVLAQTPAVRAAAVVAAGRNDIEVRTYFAVPLHRMPALASVPSAAALRWTDHLAERALSLPMANDLSPGDIDAIVASLAETTVPAPDSRGRRR